MSFKGSDLAVYVSGYRPLRCSFIWAPFSADIISLFGKTPLVFEGSSLRCLSRRALCLWNWAVAGRSFRLGMVPITPLLNLWFSAWKGRSPPGAVLQNLLSKVRLHPQNYVSGYFLPSITYRTMQPQISMNIPQSQNTVRVKGGGGSSMGRRDRKTGTERASPAWRWHTFPRTSGGLMQMQSSAQMQRIMTPSRGCVFLRPWCRIGPPVDFGICSSAISPRALKTWICSL